MKTTERLQKAFDIIAFASLQTAGEPLLLENIEAESARIERCVDFHYKTETHDMEYTDFVTSFLQENYKDIVFTSVYDGDWLDDVKDTETEGC